MDKQDLINKIENLIKNHDAESAHLEIDRLIVEYLNIPELTRLFEEKDGWGMYA